MCSLASGDMSWDLGEGLGPIQGVVDVLDREAMTGTNKLGLLLVLIEIATERMASLGRGSFDGVSEDITICKKELACRYLRLHWEHGRKYGDEILRQTSHESNTVVLKSVNSLREFLTKRAKGGLQDRSFEVILRESGEADWKTEWKDKLDLALGIRQSHFGPIPSQNYRRYRSQLNPSYTGPLGPI